MRISEEWSAISPGDLGLKAAYWVNEPGGDFLFRPIVGWVTFTRRNLLVPTDPAQRDFQPVVIADNYWPALAITVPKAIGVFPNDMNAEGVRATLEKWNAAGESGSQISPPQGGMTN